MNKTYIIAEIGNSHEGSLGLAKCFIRAAAECGVDAVKFQTHIFEAESLESAPNPPYFRDETRKSYFERTSFSVQQWKELRAFSEDLKLDFFSSPFSVEAVELLIEVGTSIFKIPSGEVTNIPLLERIGQTKKKVLLSSGMSTWSELDLAVGTLRDAGCEDLTVLQCTSEYPCPPQSAGLNVLDQLKERYKDISVGYSDHTVGLAVPLAAVVKGASVIEKHFTLSTRMYGSDAINATEPNEFRRLVTEIRRLDQALSSNIDKDEAALALSGMKLTFEKSIVSSCSLAKSEVIEFKHLSFKKPGDGIPASKYKQLIGKILRKDIPKDHKFEYEDFS